MLLRISILLLSILYAFEGKVAPSDGCKVCEDVMQVWHDHYRCAGEIAISDKLKVCDLPSFSCETAPSSIKPFCLSISQQLRTNLDLMKSAWEHIFYSSNVYKTCAKLAYCEPDPSKELEDKRSQCHKALKSPGCKENIACPEIEEKCSKSCAVCNFLLRDFPVFQGICMPPRAEAYGAIQNANLPNSFLALDTRVKSSETSHERAKMNGNSFFDSIKKMASSVPTSSIFDSTTASSLSAQVPNHLSSLKPGRTATMKEQERLNSCFSLYDRMRGWKKAIFFSSWKKDVSMFADHQDAIRQQIWDSNVVCQCLGMCPVSKYHDLELIRACHYDENIDAMMAILLEHNEIEETQIWE